MEKLALYVIIALGAYYFYFRAHKLNKDSIVNSWNTLITAAAGKQDAVFRAIREGLETHQPPRIVSEEQVVADSVIGSLSGAGEFTKWTMLLVRNTRLSGFVSYISVRDYGTALQVSWYSTVEKSGFSRFIAVVSDIHWAITLFYLPFILVGRLVDRLSKKISPENMGVFDQEELSAYSTVVHAAVKDAVEHVMQELHQDFTAVDIKTRGFLNLS